MVGVVLTFIPGVNLGKRIMTKMEEPAQAALQNSTPIRRRRAPRRPGTGAVTPKSGDHPRRELRRRAAQTRPRLDLPKAEELKDKIVKFPFRYDESEMIR